jgi:hypothetical protein
MNSTDRHSSSESHAVLVAEIARLRETQKLLADLVSTVALATERGVIKNIDPSWVREARAVLAMVQPC